MATGFANRLQAAAAKYGPGSYVPRTTRTTLGPMGSLSRKTTYAPRVPEPVSGIVGGEGSRLGSLGVNRIGIDPRVDYQEQENYQDSTVNTNERTRQIEQLLEQFLQEQQQQQREDTESTSTRGDAETTGQMNEYLEDIIPAFLQQYSKDAAVTDSQDAMQAAVNAVLNKGLPEIRSAVTMSGGRNSTFQGLAGGFLGAQAAQAGAQTTLGNITNYGNISTNAMKDIYDLLAVKQGGTVTNRGTNVGSTSGRTSGTSSTTGRTDVSRLLDQLARDTGYSRGTGLDNIDTRRGRQAGTASSIAQLAALLA